MSSEITQNLADRAAQLVTRTENQYAFVEEYLRCKSAPHAVVRCGWVERVGIEAIYIGKEFMLLDEIKDTLFAAQSMEIMQPHEVLSALTTIARASLEDMMTLEEVDDEQTLVLDWKKAVALDRLGAVKKIKHTKFGVEVELYDRLAALRMLGQRAGLFQQVAREESWRTAAIRDIRAGTLNYAALVDAFQDEEVIRELFNDAGVSPPDQQDNLFEDR